MEGQASVSLMARPSHDLGQRHQDDMGRMMIEGPWRSFKGKDNLLSLGRGGGWGNNNQPTMVCRLDASGNEEASAEAKKGEGGGKNIGGGGECGRRGVQDNNQLMMVCQ